MPLLGAYDIGLTFITGRVSSRAFVPHVRALLAAAKLDVEAVTTRLAAWDGAIDAILDLGVKTVVARS